MDFIFRQIKIRSTPYVANGFSLKSYDVMLMIYTFKLNMYILYMLGLIFNTAITWFVYILPVEQEKLGKTSSCKAWWHDLHFAGREYFIPLVLTSGMQGYFGHIHVSYRSKHLIRVIFVSSKTKVSDMEVVILCFSSYELEFSHELELLIYKKSQNLGVEMG